MLDGKPIDVNVMVSNWKKHAEEQKTEETIKTGCTKDRKDYSKSSTRSEK